MSRNKEKLMTNVIDWIKDRIAERTSWDGAACIVLGLIVLGAVPISPTIAQGAAMVGIAWGVWTMWKKEN